jgi:hypothetical protein
MPAFPAAGRNVTLTSFPLCSPMPEQEIRRPMVVCRMHASVCTACMQKAFRKLYIYIIV